MPNLAPTTSRPTLLQTPSSPVWPRLMLTPHIPRPSPSGRALIPQRSCEKRRRGGGEGDDPDRVPTDGPGTSPPPRPRQRGWIPPPPGGEAWTSWISLPWQLPPSEPQTSTRPCTQASPLARSFPSSDSTSALSAGSPRTRRYLPSGARLQRPRPIRRDSTLYHSTSSWGWSCVAATSTGMPISSTWGGWSTTLWRGIILSTQVPTLPPQRGGSPCGWNSRGQRTWAPPLSHPMRTWLPLTEGTPRPTKLSSQCVWYYGSWFNTWPCSGRWAISDTYPTASSWLILREKAYKLPLLPHLVPPKNVVT